MLGVGVDGGWMALPTRPQRYCDPASLVLLQITGCGNDIQPNNEILTLCFPPSKNVSTARFLGIAYNEIRL